MTTHKLSARRGERIEKREIRFKGTGTMAKAAWFRKLLLGISPLETCADRRGFPVRQSAARTRLEAVGATFVRGYSVGLESPEPSELEAALRRIPSEQRGFAYEGAAMSLGLLDGLTPWNRTRLQLLLDGPGDPHVYMIYVGLGWARARLRKRRSTPWPTDDSLLGWLVFDGYGFHEGFFNWRKSFQRGERPSWLGFPAARVFDQGLGRCSWFVFGAEVERVAHAIACFSEQRREDLWGGVGLAAAYAGGVSGEELSELARLSGMHRGALAQGAAFAAQARARAGSEAEHTDRACREFSGASAREAAALTELHQRELPSRGSQPAYLVWRERIREQLQ